MEGMPTTRWGNSDRESLSTRIDGLFTDPESFMGRPLDMLGGKTPEEVMESGTDEEREELAKLITAAETPPLGADTNEAQ